MFACKIDSVEIHSPMLYILSLCMLVLKKDQYLIRSNKVEFSKRSLLTVTDYPGGVKNMFTFTIIMLDGCFVFFCMEINFCSHWKRLDTRFISILNCTEYLPLAYKMIFDWQSKSYKRMYIFVYLATLDAEMNVLRRLIEFLLEINKYVLKRF